MLERVLPAALLLALTCPLAHADIYTWVDKSGTINVSNLPPPEGVRVTNVMHETPAKRASGGDGAGDATPDVQFLAERVRQLEQEVELAKRQAPPPIPYPMVPPPMAYPVLPPPAVQYSSVQYQIVEAPPTTYGGYGPAANGWDAGCDPSWWANCATWWGPVAFPSVVVVTAPGFRRPFPPQAGHRFPMPKAGRVGGVQRG